MSKGDIYDPAFVARLFDEMSASYGITNYVSSFGFSERWRRQCVEDIELEPGMVVLDLMTGMGECWHFLRDRMNGEGRILALDISQEMCRQANRKRARVDSVSLWRDDALCSALPDKCADWVVTSFGLKTFSLPQLRILAREISRLLKPGGAFAFVEIAVPHSPLLRAPYLWYLRYVIPIIGRIFLGNPDNYRMLAVYTERFSDGSAVVDSLRAAGLSVRLDELFFGCARRFTGEKAPEATSGFGSPVEAGLGAMPRG